MVNNACLNGCDYLMLGFDHELRRGGFAGNSCQIILELGSAISPDALKTRLANLVKQYPILSARPGGVFFPRWNSNGNGVDAPQIRVHRDDPALRQQIFNEPLAINHGELLRFDLIQHGDERMTLIFTWMHALMDAPGAEYLLALIGSAGFAELPLPAARFPQAPRPKPPLKERLKSAWKYLDHLDEFCKFAPRAIGSRHPEAPTALNYRVEKLSVEETEQVRSNCARYAGVLGEAQYHAAVSVLELHRLHQRLGCPSPSYVLPFPVGLRLKGSIEPMFSNQVSMLMFQFLPDQADSLAGAVGALKTQTCQAMRSDLLDSGRTLGELFRFLPLSIYVAVLKHGLRGEICSLFYGDTSAVNPQLTTFLGAPVEDFAHVAAVTPSPGLGVIFYHFRGRLRITILHSARVLNDTEAAEFAANFKQRLLNP